jgi:hypothetical protein
MLVDTWSAMFPVMTVRSWMSAVAAIDAVNHQLALLPLIAWHDSTHELIE